ncbi:MAG: prepilin-type cleavage/methylation domain-containing protein, partial [Verrucomicrobiales bacterium]|nr:prepilin-type cleavage/methylation domain-containing protein [Verrucomicrobiales bacterium]
RNATYSRIAPNYRFDSNSSEEDFSDFSQQIPPLVRVTMVAIDEAAAVRYSDSGGTMPAELMAPLSGLFKNTDSYDDDIQKLTDALNELKVSHKVFSSMVMLRSAKWSS